MKPLFTFIDLLAVVWVLVFVRLVASYSSFFSRRQCNAILYAEETTLAIALYEVLLCSTFLLEVLGAVSVLVLMRAIPCMRRAGPSMLRKRSPRKANKNMIAAESNDHDHLLDGQHMDASSTSSRINDHDIFLSYSGVQKGFVSNLHSMLDSAGYTVFFDVSHPFDIFSTAATCKLAVVVLSHDFLLSKWPMAELCAFVEKEPTVKILPLFYKLSPVELKLKENLKRWRRKWRALAKQDRRHVDVAKWEHALHVLGTLNGVVFGPTKGEISYLQKILSIISEIVKPMIKFDMPGVQGKDRLMKILISKFEELEWSPAPTSSSAAAKVCVLGMYGLPGSGKSLLSKCLTSHYAHQFNGRSLYLELPTSPTDHQLVEISKDLLQNACIDFRNRVELKDVTELDQVYPLLQSYLQSSSLFLVVDNINITHCQSTTEFVKCILTCHFQPGSKVLLVARSLHALDDLQGKGKYAFASVRVPTINREEATQILMNSAQNWFSESGAEEDKLDLTEREIVEDVISNSSFGNNQNPEYLPLIVKIMGGKLRECRRRSDLGRWGLDMDRFWNSVQVSKEDALMQLVEKTFDTLPPRLQLLFLDVALFVLPHPFRHRSATSILSIMHEKPMEGIEVDMAELLKRCFFEQYVERGSIIVHDVFLEFAAIFPNCCRYYSSTRHGVIDLIPNELPPPAEKAKELGLRAVVLELNERHAKFSFWEGFSSVKVLVFRNCGWLESLHLPVGLQSLVILEIHNCPKLSLVEVKNKVVLYSVKSFIWNNSVGSSTFNIQESRSSMERPMLNHQESRNSMERHMLNHQESRNSMNMPQQSDMVLAQKSTMTQPPTELLCFALAMKNLQEVRLAHTGIKRLEDISKCWPQLRLIHICETSLEHFEVGNLYYLEDFAFTGGVVDKFLLNEKPYWPIINLQSTTISGSPRSRCGGKNLLIGCPKLKSVCLLAACLENGLGILRSSQLQTLHLGSYWHADSFPDLAAASCSLRTVMAWDCRQLKHVNFVHQFGDLKEVHLVCCPRISEVTGLDRLCSLCDLRILKCANLQTVSGLGGLKRLQSFQLQDCDSLRSLSGVRDLVSLVTFDVGRGCPMLEMDHSDLQNLTKLVDLYYNQHSFQHSFPPRVLELRNLLPLKYLTMVFNKGVPNSGMSASLENLAKLRVLKLTGDEKVADSDEKMVNSCDMVEVATLMHVDFATLSGVSDLSNLLSISRVEIKSVHNLANLRGIGFLSKLKTLSLENLGNLSCLQGIEGLLGLEMLVVDGCDSVKELPSLSPLVNLKNLTFKNCAKLKDLHGCDAMEKLQLLKVIGCKGMARFPLSDAVVSRLNLLSIEGSKFASIDALVAWAVQPDDKKGSLHIGVLRKASIRALEWEFRHNFCEAEARINLAKLLLRRVGVLSQFIPSNDACCIRVREKLPTYSWGEEVSFPAMTVELLHGLERETKRYPKIKCCQLDAELRDLLISYLAEAPPSVLEFLETS